MPTNVKLLKSWPPIARDIVLDAARYYYREMKEPWPVAEAIMARAIEWANKDLATREREIYTEASAGWINRWESGKLDAEMTTAIQEMYQRLSRAEGAIRPRTSVRKKSPRQLEAEIASALSEKRR